MRTCMGLRWSCLFAVLVPAFGRAQTPASKAVPKPQPPSAALTALIVYPPQITLEGPRAEQRLGVLGESANGQRWDLCRDAKITCSSDAVAVVDKEGVVRPVGDGAATLTVNAGGKSATIPVKVSGATADVPVSFSREIVPILT